LRSLEGLAAEPERNHGTVHAVLEQLHREGVSKGMRGRAFSPQRRTACPGRRDMLSDDVLDTRDAQVTAASAGEDRI
jgi:hypothetical protein